MAIVIHYPHGKDKQGYAYEHRRVGKQVKSIYMGKFEVSTQPELQDGFRDRPGYEERHEYASRKEEEDHPITYEELNKIIEERLDEGELAAKYEGDQIIINEKIPNKYHKQLIEHELYERQYHREKYPEVEGAGVKDGSHRHDQSDPEGLHDHPQYEHRGAKGNIQKERAIRKAMRHPDTPGAGVEKRKSIRNAQTKYEAVMREYKRGTLYSSSGKKVHDVKQAQAIAFSEARKVDPDYGK